MGFEKMALNKFLVCEFPSQYLWVFYSKSFLYKEVNYFVFFKWADKSTTSYDMLDFKSYREKKLTRTYLVTERHIFSKSYFCNI